jgi:drug/metabolite transporter (DMT)-like permease
LASYLIVRGAIAAGWIEIRLVNRRSVLARGILGSIGNLLYFYAIAQTHLSNAIVLLYTYPIFASLLSRWIEGVMPSFSIIVTLVASFSGIYLIVHPSFDHPLLGNVLAILSGIMVGGAIVSLKESRKTDTAWTIFHYFNITGIILSLPLVMTQWAQPGRQMGLPPWHSIGPLAGVVVFSMLGQIWMTYAYRYCTTAEGSVLSMFGAVVGSALGILFLAEPTTPRFITGALMVIISGIYLTVRGSD